MVPTVVENPSFAQVMTHGMEAVIVMVGERCPGKLCFFDGEALLDWDDEISLVWADTDDVEADIEHLKFQINRLDPYKDAALEWIFVIRPEHS